MALHERIAVALGQVADVLDQPFGRSRFLPFGHALGRPAGLSEGPNLGPMPLASLELVAPRPAKRHAAHGLGMPRQRRILLHRRHRPHELGPLAVMEFFVMLRQHPASRLDLRCRGLARPTQHGNVPVELPRNRLALRKNPQAVPQTRRHFVAPRLDRDAALAPGLGQRLAILVQRLALNA